MTESQTPLPTKPAVTAAAAERPAATSDRVGSLRRFAGWFGWHVWAILAIVLTGGLGLYALKQLVRLPSLPECESTVWIFAPASKRLYCGQSYANGGTAYDFLAAIDLVDVLGSEHPLRGEANEQIDEWTTAILDLGEAKFQAGNLDEALQIAERVPTHLGSQNLVETRTTTWQELWTKATDIVARVQELTIEAEWEQAEILAAKLGNLQNEYWSGERYEATLTEIRGAKDEYERLGFARAAVSERASTNELLDALEKALSIESSSLFYERAQELAVQASEMLVVRGQQAAGREDWSGVLEVGRALPRGMDLEEFRRDFRELGRAGLHAKQGTIATLENAIATITEFEEERPLYDEAQKAIARWELEIQDIGHLTAARSRASSGSLSDLRAAINEANKIAQGNPRHQEAQQEIWRWAAQVQTIEDRPILSRARQQAQGGTIGSWQQAIATASRVAPRRTLYREAQQLIGQWRVDIQRAEDAPILDRARALARGGRLQEAIATAGQVAPGRALHGQARGLARQWRESIERAEDTPILDRAWALAQNNRLEEAIATVGQIAPGRVLYSQAQGLANRWRAEIQAGQDMQRAYQVASSGSPWALAQAIRFAGRVPGNTSYSDRSRQAIEDWSRRILDLARQESATNLSQAIQIANLVPPNSQAHASARQQVAVWQNLLNPPEPAPSPEETTTPAAAPESVQDNNAAQNDSDVPEAATTEAPAGE